jgi:glycosyltransferase involved in cell wall biosynthesis
MVTPVGGLPEIVGPLARSCILSGTNSQGIAEGLSTYLDGRLPAPASADCIAYVEQNFTWEKVARNVLEVYDDAFRRKHGESQAKRVMSVG